MTLIRWEPMREIDAVRREMDRLLGDFISTGDRDYFDRNSFIPAVELAETDDAVILKLEIPGIATEDLDIQATAESVTIQGERQSEQTVAGEQYNRSEFRYGKFRRVVPLPVRVQNTASQASYKDGLLTLTLPKAEVEKNKVVKVSVEAA